MLTVTIILSIIQSMSISLGVGSSTMAILNFFKAIADGSIDPVERGFMGITYIVLRVAMVFILLTTAGLAAIGLSQSGTEYTNNFVLAQFLLTTILFVNATLMTARIMPSTLGPAIQASAWYSLGFVVALVPHGLTDFNFPIFLAGYVIFTCVVIYIIRTVMAKLAIKRLIQTNTL